MPREGYTGRQMKDLIPGELAVVDYECQERLVFIVKHADRRDKMAIDLSDPRGRRYWYEISLNTLPARSLRQGEEFVIGGLKSG